MKDWPGCCSTGMMTMPRMMTEGWTEMRSSMGSMVATVSIIDFCFIWLVS